MLLGRCAPFGVPPGFVASPRCIRGVSNSNELLSTWKVGTSQDRVGVGPADNARHNGRISSV